MSHAAVVLFPLFSRAASIVTRPRQAIPGMIISGGVNVYPRDIEEIVAQHPDVQEVAVLGIPHEKWGETPVAAVILHKPGSITAEALRDWINARVAAKFQRVHDVVIMEDFPRNVAGKTLKRVMRDNFK